MTSELDSLFDVPPAGFVRARNELAKSLKAAGKRDAAAEAAKLARPSASVWATNQVARRAPDLVKQLAAATDRLGKTTPGPARADFSERVAAHRDLLNRVRAEAEKTARDNGVRASHEMLTAVVQNFRAGLTDPARRRDLEAGRLIGDVGGEAMENVFGLALAASAAGGASGPPRSGAPKETPARPPERDRGTRSQTRMGEDSAAVERDQARAAARERERQLESKRQAEQARAGAEHRVRQAKRAVQSATEARIKQERAAESARAALAAADARLDELRAKESEAEAELSTASAEVARLEG